MTTPLTPPPPPPPPLLTGMPEEVVIKNYRRDGSAFWNLIHIMPVSDVYGKVRTYTRYLLSKLYCDVLYCFVIIVYAFYVPACPAVHSNLPSIYPYSSLLLISFFPLILFSSSLVISSLLFSFIFFIELSNTQNSFLLSLSDHDITHHIILLIPLQVVLVVGCHTEVSYVTLCSTTLHVSYDFITTFCVCYYCNIPCTIEFLYTI